MRQIDIAIVDDKIEIGESLKIALEDEGFNVVIFSDGREALNFFKENIPKIVFLDIWMPNIDGLEVLKILTSEFPTTKVVMISGHASISTALETTKSGAFDFLEKPLSLNGVLATVYRALELLPLKSSDQELVVKHPSAFSKFAAGRNIGQRTLNRSVVLYGQGIHSGNRSGLVLEPLPVDSGIQFTNVGSAKSVPAFVSNVRSTNLATTLTEASAGVRVSTIEHLMSALHALKITNLLVKCDSEVPILDGSSKEFCEAILEVGIKEQGGEWYEIVLDREYEFNFENEGEETLPKKVKLYPSTKFEVDYTLHYPEPIGVQKAFWSEEISYQDEIAPARTFGFIQDIEKLQRAGLAAGGRLNNFILISAGKPVNTPLRFPNELARHKILDLIGDLYLLNRPLRFKIVAEMSGHTENFKILKSIYDSFL